MISNPVIYKLDSQIPNIYILKNVNKYYRLSLSLGQHWWVDITDLVTFPLSDKFKLEDTFINEFPFNNNTILP